MTAWRWVTMPPLLAWSSDVPVGFTGKSLDLSAGNVAVLINNTAANDAAYRTTFDEGIGTRFTATFWFKAPVGPDRNLGRQERQYAVRLESSPTLPKVDFTMRNNTGETVPSALQSTNGFNDGAWHHVAEVLDGWAPPSASSMWMACWRRSPLAPTIR